MLMDWITDRPPTKADADPYGDVIIPLNTDAWDTEKWHNVPAGTPWIAFKPADAANFLNDVAAAVEAGKPRRIVSISRTVYGATHTIDAVADDGTAWFMVPSETGEDEWTQLPALPQREIE